MSAKAMKNSRCADIINPFEFISRNRMTSNKCEAIHGENITFYVKKSKRNFRENRHGTQLMEDKANDRSFDLHDLWRLNCDF